MGKAGEMKSKTLDSSVQAAKPPLMRGRVVAKTPGMRKLNRGRRRKAAVPSLPPVLELVTSTAVVRRFNNSATATSVPVTRRSLGACLGGTVTVANTTVRMIFTSYRIREVIIWPSSNSSVLWDVPASQSGAEQALQKESAMNALVPTGITVTGPTVWRPKPGTYLDMWQSTDNDPTDAFFQVTAAAGTVIDVHLVACIGGCVSATPSWTTSSTIALGEMVCGPLDTSNKFVVVGYQAGLY